MKRIQFILSVCLLMLFANVAKAGIETTANYYRLSHVTSAVSPFSIQDNKYLQSPYTYTPPSNNAFVLSSTGRVSLRIFDTSVVATAGYNTNHTFTLWVKIVSYDVTGTQANNTVIKPLTVTYNPAAGSANSIDISTIIVNGAHKMLVYLLDPTNHNLPLSNFSFPINLALDIQIETDRYYLFNSNFSWTNTGTTYGYNKIFNTNTGNVESLEAYWAYVPGAEEYDLEWTYVDDYAASNLSTTLPPSQLSVHFKNNATRVTVTSNSYKIPVVNERGYIIFRVRGIGKDLNNLNNIEGNWSVVDVTPPNLPALLSTYPAACVFQVQSTNSAPHVNDNLNWQYNATFAEDGKRKHIVTYADGTLRSRQVITENNSDNTVIIGESIYDHQGRKAIDILPVPDPNQNNIFSYNPFFNLNSSATPTPYDKNDFDKNIPNGCTTATPSLSPTAGASMYYSSNSITGINKDGFQKYVPNAFGYPIVQTEYMPDNTGRIRTQTGVGDNFYLGTGHETKYDYATPDQTELDMMFGTDVGNCVHYKKNMVTDANGQTSISYINMEGKTIATALSGDNSSSFDNLPGNNSITISSTYIQTHLTIPPSAPINGNTVINDALVFSKDILIDGSNTNYTINYDVSPEEFTTTCFDKSILCYDCIYDLQITLQDNCGNEYVPANSNINGVTYSGTSNTYSFPGTSGYNSLVGNVQIATGFAGFETSGCHNASIFTPPPISLVLQPGTYKLTKTLTVNKDALNFYTQQYINSSCVAPFSAYVDTANASIPTNGCNTPCTNCLQAPTLCEASYQALLMDVSPGGQYAQFDDNNGVMNASAYGLSILNPGNSLPKVAAVVQTAESNSNPPYVVYPFWTHPIFNGSPSKYRYPNGMIAYIPVDINDPYYTPSHSYVKQITLDGTGYFVECPNCTTNYVYGVTPDNLNPTDPTAFVQNWMPSFARELVEYHPEFSYYQFCITQAGASGHYYPKDYYLLTNSASQLANPVLATTNATGNGNIPSMLDGTMPSDFKADWLSSNSLYTGSGSNSSWTATTLTSDEFDAFLRTQVQSTSDATKFLGGSDAINTSITPVPNATAINLTTDLIDQDPLFRIASDHPNDNPFIAHSIYGSNTVAKMRRFRQMMLDKLKNLGTAAGSSVQLNIKQVFLLNSPSPLNACQNVYYQPSSTSACAITTTPPSGTLTDSQWRSYVSFYLSEKQEIVKMMADEFAKVPDYINPGSTGLYGYTANSPAGVDYFAQLNGNNPAAYVPNSTNASQKKYRVIKGYNGCIGNSSFAPFTHDFLRTNAVYSDLNIDPNGGGLMYNYSGLVTQIHYFVSNKYNSSDPSTYNVNPFPTTVGWGYLDKGQTCNANEFGGYASKTKRFESGDEYGQTLTATNVPNYTSLSTITNYQYYQQTGLCPIVSDLNTLLGQMVSGGFGAGVNLGTTSTTPLWINSSFTKQLYDACITSAYSNGPNDPFYFLVYNPSFSGNTLSVSLTYLTDPAQWPGNPQPIPSVNTNVSNFFQLTIPSTLSSFSAITSIVGISNVSSITGGGTSFVLQVKDANNNIYNVDGTTDLPLQNCVTPYANNPPQVCPPTQFSTDMVTLMNALLQQSTGGTAPDLTSTTGITLNPTTVAEYNGFMTNAIYSQLGVGSQACTWSWSSNSAGTIFQINSSTSGCTGNITITLQNSLQSVITTNGYSYDSQSGNYNVSITGIQFNQTTGIYELIIDGILANNIAAPTAYIPITINNLQLTNCNSPQNPLCTGIEYSNYTDVSNFLNQVNVFGPILTTPLTPISNFPGFTTSLANQLPMGTNVNYYIQQATISGNTISYNIVYNVPCGTPGAVIIGSGPANCYLSVCTISYDFGFDPNNIIPYVSNTATNPVVLGTVTGSGTVWNANLNFTASGGIGNGNTGGNGIIICTGPNNTQPCHRLMGSASSSVSLPVKISTCFPAKKCVTCPASAPVTTKGAPTPCMGSTAWNDFITNSLVASSAYTDATSPYYLDQTTFCTQGLDQSSSIYVAIYTAFANLTAAVNANLTAVGMTPLPTNPLDPSSNYFVSLYNFTNEIGTGCKTAYLTYLNNLINQSCMLNQATTIGCSDYPVLTFNQFAAANCGSQCIPNLHTALNPPTPTLVDQANTDCVTQLQSIDSVNAHTQYNQYLANQISIFQNAYISKCLQAKELFNATYDSKKYHYTLYYYDQAGNLVKTVPPAGFNLIDASTPAGQATLASVKTARDNNAGVSVTPAHAMSTIYRYNSLNQLISQRLPDHDYYTSNFYYDKLGRMVASQSPKQSHSFSNPAPALLQYSYTKYDILGRITEVGEISSPNSPQGMGVTTPNNIGNDVLFTNWLNGVGISSYTKHQITSTLYDLPTHPLSDFQTDFLRQRVAATSIDVDGDGVAENTTHYSYDVHGNVSSLIHSDNYNPTETIGDKRVDYTYDLISGKVNTVDYQNGQMDQFHHQYYYDADNRIIEVYTSKDAQIWAKDAKYFYYLHGPLARTEIGEHKVQAYDNYYTMQGWIKGVNSEVSNMKNDPGRDGRYEGTSDPYAYSTQTVQADIHTYVAVDAFAYSLGYYENSMATVNNASTNLQKDYVPVKNGATVGYTTDDPYADFSANIASTYATNAPNLYNGNIKHTGTTISNPHYTNNMAGDYYMHSLPMLQTFRYDQLNRIAEGSFFYGYTAANSTAALFAFNDASNGGFNKWTAATSDINNNTYTYDRNGNLTNVNRRLHNANGTFSNLDALTYHYKSNGSTNMPPGLTYNTNKLAYVSDAGDNTTANVNFDIKAGQSTSNYSYDEIGNLTSDVQQGFASVTWNVYGKIEKVTRTPSITAGNDLEFRYNSKGERIMKIAKPHDNTTGALKPQPSWVYTIYQRDAQGNVLAVYNMTYQNNGGSYSKQMQLTESDMYGSKRIGLMDRTSENIIAPTLIFAADIASDGTFTNINTNLNGSNLRVLPAQTFNNTLGQKRYEFTNHLGNVLNVVSDKKIPVPSNGFLHFTIDHYVADIKSATDYYAFGLPMDLDERQYTAGGTNYRYGFNGMESDDEVHGQAGTSYDFGARIYDPRLGRWLSVDKKVRDYANISPYVFAANNPLIFVDNDGNDIIIYNQDGQKVGVYTPGMAKNYDNALINQTIEALDAIHGVDKAGNGGPTPKDVVNYLVDNHDVEIKIKIKPYGGLPTYQKETLKDGKKGGSLFFNPSLGAAILDDAGKETGGKISPVVALAHDLKHGYNSVTKTDKQYQDDKKTPDPCYTNVEEKDATTTTEHDVAKARGEGLRETHESKNLKKYVTKGPTTTEKAGSKTATVRKPIK